MKRPFRLASEETLLGMMAPRNETARQQEQASKERMLTQTLIEVHHAVSTK